MGDLRNLPRSKRPRVRLDSLMTRAEKFSLGLGPGGEVLLFAGKDRREKVSDCPGGEGPKGKSPGFASPLPTPRPGDSLGGADRHPGRGCGDSEAPSAGSAGGCAGRSASQPASPAERLGEGGDPAACAGVGAPSARPCHPRRGTRDDPESAQTLPPDLAAFVSEPCNREIKDHRIDWGEVLATIVVFLAAVAVLQFAPPRCDSARAAPGETVLRVPVDQRR